MGPCAGVDQKLTLCPLQSLLQHVYHGQPYARGDLNSYARVDFILQSGILDLASGITVLLKQLLSFTSGYILYSNNVQEERATWYRWQLPHICDLDWRYFSSPLRIPAECLSTEESSLWTVLPPPSILPILSVCTESDRLSGSSCTVETENSLIFSSKLLLLFADTVLSIDLIWLRVLSFDRINKKV